LKCEKSDDDHKVNKTLIKLIGAFNTKDYKIGGYGIKATGVPQMVKEFDTKFLVDLQNQQKITIKPI
jgi:hypothetical protein